MIRLEMKDYNMILKEKQQKISALSSCKIDKYEQLAGEEILPQEKVELQNKLSFLILP